MAPKIDEHTELIMRNQSKGGEDLLMAERKKEKDGREEDGRHGPSLISIVINLPNTLLEHRRPRSPYSQL